MYSIYYLNKQFRPSFCAIILNDNSKVDLMPLKIDYNGEMNESVLSLAIHQKYKNIYNNYVANKAILALPQTLTQSITGIECSLNGNKIDLNIKEKQKAERIAQNAEQRGHSTIRSVTSRDEQTTEIILGLLPFNAECDIVIHLDIISTNSDLNEMQTIIPFSSQSLSDSLFSFSLIFNQISNISDISIFDNSGKKNSNFTFDGKRLIIKEKPNEPIVLTTKLNNSIPSLIMNDVQDPYSAIQLLPQFSNDLINSDFIFIVDCSGSMSGSPIRNVAECLSVFIHSLPMGCNFNIIMFGTKYATVFNPNELVQYNESTLSIADNVVKNLSADMGGTNLYGPLSCAYKQSQKSRMKGRIVQMFLLTDGQIDDKESVFKIVRKNRANNRLFSLGIGNNVDKDLVSGLAVLSNGKFDFIDYKSVCNITDRVISLLSMALAPALTNIRIHSTEGEIKEIVPNPIPAIYDGSMVMFYVKRANKTNPLSNVRIIGNIGETQVELVIEKSINNNKGIAKKLFASTAINDYENICDDLMNNKTEFNKYKSKIINLSIENKILSKFTSFIGVDQKTINEQMKLYNTYLHPSQPIQLTRKQAISNIYHQSQNMPQPRLIIYQNPIPMSNPQPYNPTTYIHSNNYYVDDNVFFEDTCYYKDCGPVGIDNYDPTYMRSKSYSNNTNYCNASYGFGHQTVNYAQYQCPFDYDLKDDDFECDDFDCDNNFNETDDYEQCDMNCCSFAPEPNFNQYQTNAFSGGFDSFGGSSGFNNINYLNQEHSSIKPRRHALSSCKSKISHKVAPCPTNNAFSSFDNSLMGIIQSQQFDGRWSYSLFENLINFLNVKCGKECSEVIEKFVNDNVKGIDIQTINDMKSTITSLCILKKIFPGEHAKWKLIILKAINWLNSIMNNQWEKSIDQLVLSFE